MPGVASNGRVARVPVALTMPASGQNITSSAITLNGTFSGYTVIAKALDASSTLTFSLIDQDGASVYTKSGIATAADAKTVAWVDANNYPIQIPLCGSYTVLLHASGASAADHIETVNLMIAK